ncbi:MAG TPA: hypothetical protein PLS75_08825 [Candidatus Marinimicrobia bacterium]|nr:hypothetical protein [Candidatus Neomarinimicrobiota bacterium]
MTLFKDKYRIEPVRLPGTIIPDWAHILLQLLRTTDNVYLGILLMVKCY